MNNIEEIKKNIEAQERKERAIFLRLREACDNLGVGSPDDFKGEPSLDRIDSLSIRIRYVAQNMAKAENMAEAEKNFHALMGTE